MNAQIYRRGRFTMDGDTPIYHGWTCEALRNGAACPMLERVEADRFVTFLRNAPAEYLAAAACVTDTNFVIVWTDGEVDKFPKITIDTAKGRREAYDLSGLCWYEACDCVLGWIIEADSCEIQRCDDCAVFENDDVAADAARAAGLDVDVNGRVTDESAWDQWDAIIKAKTGGPQAEYYGEKLIPAILQKMSVNGWPILYLEQPGTVYLKAPNGVEVYASPGWDGEDEDLCVQFATPDGDDLGSIEIPVRWTGNTESDVNTWLSAIVSRWDDIVRMTEGEQT